MKIRTRLTVFFTLIFLVLFLVIFSFLFESFKMKMFNILDDRINHLVKKIIRDKKLNEITYYEELIKLDLTLPRRKSETENKDDKNEKKGVPFFWFAILDDKLNILNQSEYAKMYPVKIELKDTKKRFFIVKFNNPENDNFFTADRESLTYAIAKSYRMITRQNKTFYIVVLHPFTEENDYLKGLTSIIITIVVAFLVIIFMLGLLYAGYSLSPIKKIIRQLNLISRDELKKRISIKNDKDEIGELSQSINSLLDRIEKAFLMEKQFISDVSHEFKTPISSLRLSIESLINDHELNDIVLDKLGANLEVLYSIDFLVKKLLYLSKLEQGIITIKKEKINLNELILKIINNLQFIAQNKNIKLTGIVDKNCIIDADNELLYIAYIILSKTV